MSADPRIAVIGCGNMGAALAVGLAGLLLAGCASPELETISDVYVTQPPAEKMTIHLELPEDAMLFVFVGRITEDKGIRELLAAFSALRAETGRTPVFLALVGWTEDYAGDKLDVPGVFRPGFQEDIRSWLEAADAFVLPSYREGFPNSLLQAGAMELPSIATDICGCNEIVKDGVNGLLVPARDEEALRQAMAAMRDDPERRGRMGAEAAEQVKSRFSCRMVWEALLHFYGRASA